MKVSKLKAKIFEIIILLAFIVIAVIVGSYHEAWADEAQSWLIAREATVPEILRYSRTI